MDYMALVPLTRGPVIHDVRVSRVLIFPFKQPFKWAS